jgi:hypothetical protein
MFVPAITRMQRLSCKLTGSKHIRVHFGSNEQRHNKDNSKQNRLSQNNNWHTEREEMLNSKDNEIRQQCVCRMVTINLQHTVQEEQVTEEIEGMWHKIIIRVKIIHRITVYLLSLSSSGIEPAVNKTKYALSNINKI